MRRHFVCVVIMSQESLVDQLVNLFCYTASVFCIVFDLSGDFDIRAKVSSVLVTRPVVYKK